ncbi:tRNA-(guanine-N1)-methyltransferase [Agaricicola taiwanensis]|uniref:tRNA-(Guanine-N1)-methyltransferase n=1 Tax=Agaricicola taiwanensis TaxID=591372 RepID=A0A8J2YIA4_9RHOB|nr:nitrite reductase small subunit NirD [Agaricicola taiwanensis]GGE44476.1 tRNA-(guanine-N1)-methyltransferase [Agaricicola taiwanensis]
MNAPATIRTTIGRIDDIPREGARMVRAGPMEIAIFRTVADEIYAIDNRCPHRGGPLSEGIVHGGFVTCPLHNWVIDLKTGLAQGADEGCVRTIATYVDADGRLSLDLPVSIAANVAA